MMQYSYLCLRVIQKPVAEYDQTRYFVRGPRSFQSVKSWIYFHVPDWPGAQFSYFLHRTTDQAHIPLLRSARKKRQDLLPNGSY